MAAIRHDLIAMIAPLKAAATAECPALGGRCDALTGTLPTAENDELADADIAWLGLADRLGANSVHLLIMDIHKALNRLAADIAAETIDGARVFHVEDWDRTRIRAFMAGLNRTARLAFGHPGLATTATRIGEHLTIQNDIGATDAHVLVVHVAVGDLTITYTDIHRRRAKFFMSLFEGKGFEWTPLAEKRAAGLEQDLFYLVTGRFVTTEPGALDGVLEFLGSRIVFLIDWNKARKALETFVGRDVAIELLTWAATYDFGHRAFLELGGADLVFRRHPPHGSGSDSLWYTP
jgi:hypothetical protein